MGKSSKASGKVWVLRRIVADNVTALMDERYASEPNKTSRQRALARDAGVSLSTVQRIVGSEVGASIDNMESLAKVFRVPPAALLTPYAGHATTDGGLTSGRDGLHRRAS
jgi:transcriptional regulator with XRE-family HTH domain